MLKPTLINRKRLVKSIILTYTMLEMQNFSEHTKNNLTIHLFTDEERRNVADLNCIYEKLRGDKSSPICINNLLHLLKELQFDGEISKIKVNRLLSYCRNRGIDYVYTGANLCPVSCRDASNDKHALSTYVRVRGTILDKIDCDKKELKEYGWL